MESGLLSEEKICQDVDLAGWTVYDKSVTSATIDYYSAVALTNVEKPNVGYTLLGITLRHSTCPTSLPTLISVRHSEVAVT
jgi:hypothetical protein